MIPKKPVTLKLKDGKEITFSVEEMNHPLFKSGWTLAEQGKGAGDCKWLAKIGNSAHHAHLYNEPITTSMSAERIRALFGKQDDSPRGYPLPFIHMVKRVFPQDRQLQHLLEIGASVVGKVLSEACLERAVTSQLVRTLIYEEKIAELKEKADKAHEIEGLYEWWCRIYYRQE